MYLMLFNVKSCRTFQEVSRLEFLTLIRSPKVANLTRAYIGRRSCPVGLEGHLICCSGW